MGQGPVHVVFILMLPGASVQPGGGALERADYRKTDHKTTGPPSQRAKRALTLTRENGISESNEEIMATKPFGLHGLGRAPFVLARARRLTWFLVAGACLLLVSGCVTWFRATGPVLYKPSCDLGPVLSLQVPEQIETLAGLPRTETVFENGTNRFGGRLPDEIKEKLYLKEGATEYTFIVFYGDTAAIKEYGRDRERHVFRETTENGLTGRLHYTEEPRADPEGGLVPMGEFISRADFRLHNLYIRVETTARAEKGEKPQNDKLTRAVVDLARMLSATLRPRK
jgi:hypothetical protein